MKFQKENKKYSIGLKFALKGIFSFFVKERNAKIHFAAAVVVIATGIYFKLNLSEWLWIALSITLVLITEMLNSAIELLCDLTTPEHNEKAGSLKDMAAGAVLIATIFSLIIALVIFWPRFFV